MLWFGLFSIACGFAWDYDSLLTLRILQGFGLGAEVPVAATYISELARAKGRGSFVLLFELVFPVGLLAVSALGTWIVPHLGWQYLFFVGGTAGAAGAVRRAQRYPNRRAGSPRAAASMMPNTPSLSSSAR